MKRISIRDKIFTECSDQGNILVDSNKYEAVIVNAAFVSRSYYEGDYDPDKLMLPTCWSSDTQVPSSDVPQEQRQAARCMDCSHNIRGSGYKSSRACRFAQQIAYRNITCYIYIWTSKRGSYAYESVRRVFIVS